MWFVVQTLTGKEEELLFYMKRVLSEQLYRRCFVIRTGWPKRLGGRWVMQERLLFPGYVFVETEMPGELFLELKQIPQHARLLGDGGDEFVPLKPEEEKFLEILIGGGGKKPCMICPSVISVRESGQIVVKSGPLKAFEREILRINLHKRYAVVRVKMLKKKTVLFGIVMEDESRRCSEIEER